MKKLYIFLFSLLVIGGSALAGPKISEEKSIYGYGYGDAFIFTEGGVEFAVFPDGQFDFFYNSRRNGYHGNVVRPHVNISYNAGYNYDPFVQYDDFGAVIQIERVPVFYDYYGRIVQAGNVYISYNHFGRISRIGGLRLHYDPYYQVSHYSGYINSYNPFYVYRPWHNYYVRPHGHYAVVHHQPYRAYYHPTRVTYNYHINYYKTYYNNNYKKSYYRPGEKVTSYHRGSRTSQAREIRQQNFDSDYSVATRIQDRNEDRKTSSPAVRSREAAARVENIPSRSSVSTARANRALPEENRNVRATRSVERQTPSVPQQNKVQERSSSRETPSAGTISRSRETRTATPTSRRNNDNGTVRTPSRASVPQEAAQRSSRSSRERGGN